MKDCCAVQPTHARQRHVLSVVLAINAAMFLIEIIAGLSAHSTALLSDAVDMLGDALVYAFSLYVIGRGATWQARSATLKAAIMGAFGVGILIEVAVKLSRGITPQADVMGAIGLLALAANGSVLAFLWRHRADDINMRSVWLCSRNDVIANGGVLLAALGVRGTHAAWPDIVVGLGIALLFMTSALEVWRAAFRPATRGRALVNRP
jgi:Co/Zn/Cd efflux system component